MKPPMITSICCNQCDVRQPPSIKCINCDLVFSTAHCNICMLWTSNTNIYHCDKCENCRVGSKEDTFHCDKCQACFAKNNDENQPKVHECWIRPLKPQICVICCTEMHFSQKSARMLRCGHAGR